MTSVPAVQQYCKELSSDEVCETQSHIPDIERLISDVSGERLDVFLSQKLGVARSFAQKLIKDGHVTQDGLPGSKRLKPSVRVSEGDLYIINMPPAETLDIEPEPVDFNVIYEDEWLLIIDKPAGLVVHPAPGNWRGTLVHGLLWRYPEMGPFNNVHRPGIVHRLDATTSGLMVVARQQDVMEGLQKLFAERSIDKDYLALVHGSLPNSSGTLSGPIGRHPQHRIKMAVVEGGSPSLTGYKVLWSKGGYSFLECRLFTGRTHQIRVHLSAFGHPLVGDVLYGAKAEPGFERVFLHSWRLAFKHPMTGESLSFRSPLPEELKRYLQGS